MSGSPYLVLRNGGMAAIESVPRHAPDAFRRHVLRQVAAKRRISALFAAKSAGTGQTEMFAVLANDGASELELLATAPEGGDFPSLTPDCPQAHLFEREMAEQFGLRPEGHPWLKPVRFSSKNALPGGCDFYRIEGSSVHEVAVGPVHAGVIEPGHFRFQCHGEEVFHLEIVLGYQHRGVEKALSGPVSKRHPYLVENLAGDTAIGHATSYCRTIETLGGCVKSGRVLALRAIALELERLANHVGDLGALAGDIGFLPTYSYNGRIRGDFLNLSALLCGSRFGRGMLTPCGVCYDLDAQRVSELQRGLDVFGKDAEVAIELLFDSPSVLARFDGAGVLRTEDAERLGIVGVAARASGLRRDVRRDHPFGIYRVTQLPVSSWETGDVFARAYVRWMEIRQSLKFLRELLESLPQGKIEGPVGALKPGHLAVSLTEAWRGEICHVAMTDDAGDLARYKVVDPSFHNWMGLAMAMRGQQISDFPLCNKSFNLSYSGHDL